MNKEELEILVRRQQKEIEDLTHKVEILSLEQTVTDQINRISELESQIATVSPTTIR
jgi:hypothetical protein